MKLQMRYLGRSGLRQADGARILHFAPNLTRDRVALDAALRQPLLFREAMSALHDVVINDLRFKPRDKTAYQEYRRQQQQAESAIHARAFQAARQRFEAQRKKPIPPQLKHDHTLALKRYWLARRHLNNHLRTYNQELWRKLMPYDPVITVADDVVFFECFSADESSYGCLTLDREGCFGAVDGAGLGTTNVDYSWDLYNSFQSLRTYRQTRFTIDPAGFEVTTTDEDSYVEEKIDLPDGWLRGFMQLQAAMGLPMRRVSLSVGTLYSLLAFLRRNRARTSPRAIRFELADGHAPRVVLEPWERLIVSHGTTYQGPDDAPIRIWGRRRLLVLARLLPLAEGVDVYLLGDGLPSFWVVRMGALRLTLGLSGWSANDWTRGTALDMLMPEQNPSPAQVAAAATALNEARLASLPDLARGLNLSPGATAATLNQLTLRGQAMYDLDAGRYRWRQALPIEASDREVGEVHPERAAARDLLLRRRFREISQRPGPRGGVIVSGTVEGKPCEALVDDDGLMRRGKCLCGFFRKYRLRNGPCRHLQVLQRWLARGADDGPAPDWYERLTRWAGR